jgi:hypothetical protein
MPQHFYYLIPWEIDFMRGTTKIATCLILLVILLSFGVDAHAISQQEREALIALYKNTAGDGWTDNSGWRATPLDADGFAMPGTECSWHGVICSSDRVIGLDLYQNLLTGSIPAELENLAYLEALDLGDNQLTGSIPPGLGNLGNLNVLWFDSNQLTGSIPPELGNLDNLAELYLFSNLLTGSIPPELGNLDNLAVLDLGGNQLSGSIPAELGNLDSVEELYLLTNRLSGSIPADLGNLTTLAVLDLAENQLGGSIPELLGNLANLEFLSLASNVLIGEIPGSLINLENLYDLDLCNNDLHTGDAGLRDFLNTVQYGGNWESCQSQLSPVINTLAFKSCMSESAATEMDVTAIEPYGDPLSYFWEALDGGQISGTGESVTFTPPESDAHACPYRVRLTVSSDVSGLSAEETIEIYVHLAGDANGDGRVNFGDLAILRSQFGQSGDPGSIAADFNADGRVNFGDLAILRNQFGQSGCACP